jgi:hypothetical protein
MTEDTTPDSLPEGGINPMEMLMALGQNNPKPDTAQGVADLMDRSFEFARSNGMADMGVIEDPETGVMLNVVRQPGGAISFSLQEQIDARRPNPRVRRGVASLTSLDSFIAHVNRFGDDDSAVFANEDRSDPSVLAVLDYHRKDVLKIEGDEAAGSMTHGEYRHGKHRSQFHFPLSDEWKAWHASDSTKMNMAEFAIFLENNVLDIAEITKAPAGTERFVEQNGGIGNVADWQALTKLARGLRIDENSTVSEAVTLNSGEGELTISNTHDTEVGGVKVKVPTMFFIEIPIFREGVFYRLPVRLRYRKDRGGVAFWYEIWRSDRSFMDAFNEAIERIRSETPAQVFYGKPEA